MRAQMVLLVAMTALMFMGCAPSDEVAVTTEVEAETAPVVADPQVGAALDPAELLGAWKLVSLGSRPVAGDVETTLEFTEDGRMGGSAGCNNYMGEYTFDEGVLAFPMAIAATKKMCPGPMMEQEDAYLSALAGFERAEVDGDTLRLHVADGDGPLVFSRIGDDEASVEEGH